MFASDEEIERKYRDKASAYASGLLNGAFYAIALNCILWGILLIFI